MILRLCLGITELSPVCILPCTVELLFQFNKVSGDMTVSRTGLLFHFATFSDVYLDELRHEQKTKIINNFLTVFTYLYVILW